MLIGYFRPLLDGAPNSTFVDGLTFMIVNGASEGTAAAETEQYRIAFDFTGSTYDSLARLSRDSGLVELVTLTSLGASRYSLNLRLEGGTGDLFRFWDSSSPLPAVPEPSPLVLLLTGLVGLMLLAPRRKPQGSDTWPY